MKTLTSFQLIFMLGSFAAEGFVQASCLAHEPEIGDIGPSGDRVCAALERDFPNANIHLFDQSIHSPTNVVFTVQIDGRPFSVEYQLENADWIKSHGPCLAGV